MDETDILDELGDWTVQKQDKYVIVHNSGTHENTIQSGFRLPNGRWKSLDDDCERLTYTNFEAKHDTFPRKASN